jgi:adenosylcobyric acid synthase
MRDCDLVVIPGTRATVNDLAWLRKRGFDEALRARAERHESILGVCGGYQMLGTLIDDDVESATGSVKGLGLLPVRTVFQPEKVLAQVEATLAGGSTMRGYEIHHGCVISDGEAFFADEGCVEGAVAGTLWHGVFENDGWRRSYLAEVAERSKKNYVGDTDHTFASRREARLDTLADLVDEFLDTKALVALLSEGRTSLPSLFLARE